MVLLMILLLVLLLLPLLLFNFNPKQCAFIRSLMSLFIRSRGILSLSLSVYTLFDIIVFV